MRSARTAVVIWAINGRDSTIAVQVLDDNSFSVLKLSRALDFDLGDVLIGDFSQPGAVTVNNLTRRQTLDADVIEALGATKHSIRKLVG